MVWMGNLDDRSRDTAARLLGALGEAWIRKIEAAPSVEQRDLSERQHDCLD
jgi:hypothetical protein